LLEHTSEVYKPIKGLKLKFANERVLPTYEGLKFINQLRDWNLEAVYEQMKDPFLESLKFINQLRDWNSHLDK